MHERYLALAPAWLGPVLAAGVPLGHSSRQRPPRLARDGAPPLAGCFATRSAFPAWCSSPRGALAGVWLLALIPLRLISGWLGLDVGTGGAALARPRAVRRRRRVGRDLAPAGGRDRARRPERRAPVGGHASCPRALSDGSPRAAALAARPLRIVQIADPHLGPWQSVAQAPPRDRRTCSATSPISCC